MTNDKLTHQDEDISAPEFATEEALDKHEFGNWPEVFGLVLTAFLMWLTFALTG
ncbi:hypothetical protein OEW28_02395 [Defluviimonas sp. WL0002]|uniref:Aa3 type cytochrome c oxidase subunit IV n=1 Tax=Albidovulum marisflavi TaxID=2984159 RepID=A0ABT2Z8L3_9RHOB|nr:hypothetical protein [Defluviimonas sp. WL0002]MCV2867473.1 hypothetical protein [Defluviimonas sp. WL0002]